MNSDATFEIHAADEGPNMARCKYTTVCRIPVKNAFVSALEQ